LGFITALHLDPQGHPAADTFDGLYYGRGEMLSAVDGASVDIAKVWSAVRSQNN
jgi:hypothetical protein